MRDTQTVERCLVGARGLSGPDTTHAWSSTQTPPPMHSYPHYQPISYPASSSHVDEDVQHPSLPPMTQCVKHFHTQQLSAPMDLSTMLFSTQGFSPLTPFLSPGNSLQIHPIGLPSAPWEMLNEIEPVRSFISSILLPF